MLQKKNSSYITMMSREAKTKRRKSHANPMKEAESLASIIRKRQTRV